MNLQRHTRDLFYRLQQRSIRILAYHSVSGAANPYAVAPSVFDGQMAWLHRNGYEVIGLAEAVRRLKNGAVKPRSIAVTFDDGYRDHFTTAYPILKQHNFPAAFFVVTGAVGGTSVWEDWDLELMSWDELAQLSEEGHTIGSHTHSHPHLSRMQAVEAVNHELETSKRLIEEKLNPGFIPFAYPYGSGVFDQRVRKAVADCGFDCAVGSGGFFGNNPSTDLWGLKRHRIDRSTGLGGFVRIVKGRSDWEFVGFAKKELLELTKEKPLWHQMTS